MAGFCDKRQCFYALDLCKNIKKYPCTSNPALLSDISKTGFNINA